MVLLRQIYYEFVKANGLKTEYALWIIPIVFQGIDENYAILKFSSELRRDVVLKQYCDLIKQEFKNLYNLDVEIKAVD